MIREKAQDLLNLLKKGKGSATIFGSSYYDEEILKIIEIVTNECKSTVTRKDGTSKRYESDIAIHNIREIIQQLLTDKNTIKNSLVSTLTRIPGRDIPGIMTHIKIDKKVNEKGLPYIEIDKPFPENFKQIISGEIDREALMNAVIKPYVAGIIRENKILSKKHFFSRIFSPFNRKEISNEELIMRFKEYLKQNTELDEEKISNTAKYFVYNLLGNPSIVQDLINDEIQGNSLEVIGAKNKRGYSGMLENMSKNLFDILNSGSILNPNEGLKEIEDIYANMVGQLEALSAEPEKEPEKIEEQIKRINRYTNRHKQQYYGTNDYKIVDVGLNGKDVDFTKTEYVSKAMELYSEEVSKLLGRSEELTEEEYIREVTKLHFRFIQIHPFPEGNGRTARAISNMLLLEKGLVAVFDKENKEEYLKDMEGVRRIVDKEYIEALYTDHSVCERLEKERDYYKLEEYIGMTCLGKNDLYKDRQITTELPVIDVERVE